MTVRNMKFLLVEDNELDVEEITRGFKAVDCSDKLFHVDNAIDALDLLRGLNGDSKLEPPFVILLDLNMPRMTGIEFLKELRSDASIANAPVYVLTTSDREKDLNEAYAFNIIGYVVKPVDVAQLIAVASQLKGYWKL